jgi:hypothetical protein
MASALMYASHPLISLSKPAHKQTKITNYSSLTASTRLTEHNI